MKPLTPSATSRKNSTKADPFFAQPPGGRESSAWLTKQRADAEATAVHIADYVATRPFLGTFLPTNPLDSNDAFVRQASYMAWACTGSNFAGLVCLCEWHGEAALPVLAARLDARGENKALVRLIGSFHSVAAQDLLFAHLDLVDVREALVTRAKLWPFDTLRRLLALSPRRGTPTADLLLRLLESHPDWQAALQAHWAANPGDADAQAARSTLQRLQAVAESVSDAGLDELPPLLRDPPWKRKDVPAPPPMLQLSLLQDKPRVHWELLLRPVEPRPHYTVPNPDANDAARRRIGWAEYELLRTRGQQYYQGEGRQSPWITDATWQRIDALRAHWGEPEFSVFGLGVKADRVAAVMAAQAVEPTDIDPEFRPYLSDRAAALAALDDPLALALWSVWPARFWRHPLGVGGRGGAYFSWLKRFDGRHIDALFDVLQPDLREQSLPVLQLFEWEPLSLWISREGFKSRYARANAIRLLRRYPACAARALIPAAFGADEAEQAHARHHLRRLALAGHEAVIVEQAARYGPEAGQAVAHWLATAPEAILPPKLPTLPKWLVWGKLPRLILREGGRAVPVAQLPDALMPMALSKAGMAYAGLPLLQQALTPESLSAFMLGLFDQWEDNGCPPKDRWIFEQQGLMGNDATARHLVPRIRQWRQGLIRQRAYEGLEMLVQIGSDGALTLLHGFTQQKRFTDLAERATRAMAEIAQERGLSVDELADRTVPALGLDVGGRRHLDFGPRQFELGIGMDLEATLRDGSGKRLAALPKPNAQDDAALAKAAAAEFKEFKQQLKAAASAQLIRLEAAMSAQRRWRVGEFQRFFVEQPLVLRIAQRLVWGLFEAEGRLGTVFRVTAEGTPSDLSDAPVEWPDEPEEGTDTADDPETAVPTARPHVGLLHPLALPEADRTAWAGVLADYELLQPFEQLTRQAFVLDAETAPLADLPRYAGRRVGTGSLLGLEARGWKRQTGDGGEIDRFSKPLGEGLAVTLDFDNGWFVAGPPPSGESHAIHRVMLVRTDDAPADQDAGAPTWAQLPPIVYSELVRDLEKMAWHTSP